MISFWKIHVISFGKFKNFLFLTKSINFLPLFVYMIIQVDIGNQ